MSRSSEIRDALTLMRPDQWTILTFQFMVPVMLVAPAARGGGCWFNPASGAVMVASWLVWVVLLNGATLAFNSAYDKDTGPVAYLPNPPAPPSWLASVSALIMVAGIALAYLVIGKAFALLVGFSVLLSVLYSHPLVRLKSKPGLDLLVNMQGYGAGTTLAGLLAGKAADFGASGNACAAGGWRHVPWPALQGTVVQQLTAALSDGGGWFVLGFGLLFGSFYPLTQLYQLEEDRRRGDRTLCTWLGPRLSLLLAIILGLSAGAAFAAGLGVKAATWELAIPAAAMTAWLGHLVIWFKSQPGLDTARQEKKMYQALTLWAIIDATLLAAWYLSLH